MARHLPQIEYGPPFKQRTAGDKRSSGGAMRGLQKVGETKISSANLDVLLNSSILELFEDCLAARIVVLQTKSYSSLCWQWLP